MDKNPVLTHQDMLDQAQRVADTLLSDEQPDFTYYPTGHEQVEARIEPMEPIPADANPFHYDDFSMGTNMPRGWIIMHPGFDRKDEPLAMEWMYLVNTRTGQRIKIKLDHVPTKEQHDRAKRIEEIKYDPNPLTRLTNFADSQLPLYQRAVKEYGDPNLVVLTTAYSGFVQPSLIPNYGSLHHLRKGIDQFALDDFWDLFDRLKVEMNLPSI